MARHFNIRIFWVLAVLLLSAGPFVGLAAKNFVARNEENKAQLIFKDQLTRQVFLCEKQIDAFIEVLAGLRSFFESSTVVTREEFASFTRNSLARYPGIQALEWIPLVTEQERPRHESLAASTWGAPYRITTLAADGTLAPAPAKPVYFPVLYLEPMAGNESALGFDLGSEATRRRAILAAMEQSEAVLSDPVSLVQTRGQGTGILIFLSVFSSAVAEVTSDQDSRRGLVLLVLKLDELLKSTLLADAYLDQADYAFELVDNDVAGRSSVLHAHDAAGEAAGDRPWEIEVPIAPGGQSWTLTAWPSPAFLARNTAVNPVFVGVVTATLWELFWIALIALWNWSKSSVLNRQKRILDSVLLSMAEGVIVADSAGKVILTNHAAALMLGFGEDIHTNGIKALQARCKLPDMSTPFPAGEFPLVRAIGGEQLRDTILWVPAPNPAAQDLWLSANAAPLMSEDGAQHGGVLVLRDITDSKKSLEFSNRMNNAVEQTADSVFITDRCGVIQYANAAFEKTTGYTREEALGKTPRILKSGLNAPGHYQELWSTILSGEVFRRMIINRKKCGEVYYADQTITPMRDLSGEITHFVAVVKDMTEYRLLRQREVEMEIAVNVQQRLYPKAPPPLKNMDVAGAVFSADATCGDYFDFIPMSGNRVCLTVGDVSGHGIGPAMVMAETRAYVRSLPPEDHRPGEIMSQVNRNLIQDLSGSLFVTLILANVDADARRLVYSSAGHDTCFLMDRNGRIKHELCSLGLPLGIADLGDYPTSSEIDLEEGDILVLLTDGLADCQAHRDRFLDIQDCLALIHRHRSESAEAIINRLNEHVRNFMGEESQNDDITLVICKAET